MLTELLIKITLLIADFTANQKQFPLFTNTMQSYVPIPSGFLKKVGMEIFLGFS